MKVGDVLDGRYRIERRIGGGGMGNVWEGVDTLLGRTVAIKVLLASLADDSGFRERFRREARAIAILQGPGIVEVYDYGEIETEDSTIAYLIMQYIDGKPLSRLLSMWGRLPESQALPIIAGVADALHTAHESGIVHRDVKPGNILVRDDGSVVLVDFGIARSTENLTLTTTGVVLGTVTYMSPEQAAGENLTPHSDIYSLGVVAHQCLAGSPPFRADTPLGVLSAHLRNEPPALPADVPTQVGTVIRRSLMKEPSNRWPDAASFAAACRAVMSDAVAALNGPQMTLAHLGSSSSMPTPATNTPQVSGYAPSAPHGRGHSGMHSDLPEGHPSAPSHLASPGRHARDLSGYHSAPNVPIDAPYGGLPSGPLTDHDSTPASASPSSHALGGHNSPASGVLAHSLPHHSQPSFNPSAPPSNAHLDGYGGRGPATGNVPLFNPPYPSPPPTGSPAWETGETPLDVTGASPSLTEVSKAVPVAAAGRTTTAFPSGPTETLSTLADPVTTPRDDEEDEEAPPPKRRLWLIVLIIIALLGGAGTIAAIAPWERPLRTEVEPSGETGENTEGDPASVEENPQPPVATDSVEEIAGDDPTETPSPTPSDESSPTTSPDLSPTPSNSDTSSPTPSPTPSEEPDPTTTVPDVVDRSESEARQRIEEAALNPRVHYRGEGDVKCSVVTQYPRPGTEVDEDTSVSVTVKRAEDEDDC
ncbi:serine/threonine protein kinase [Natronoglycomyces albus]|uniref:non-specific serine/threonine protein kinase n=1 Tax=Natronoglycomyces albus TaxID=2811108 RepID=A0A895XWQ8_9ACTN|nr:serine/threonine protein kinase [Natronoglycomyces albus]QSB06068.1 serine/threonine protein kinase [Natronoglycomyces albus]